CKVAHKGHERTIEEGMEQTAAYKDRCAARAGHLVVFDRRAAKSWDEKIFRRDVDREGRVITVWGT
ncbi:MAG: ATP-binding protein, partial [Acidobacteriota bacterium]|nr:ATP-binding protein [Acidobacteriota bacterium]